MKIFAICFEYAPYKAKKGYVGVRYIRADSAEEARQSSGLGGIFEIREITIEELVRSGAIV